MGAVVIRDVRPWSKVVGSPSRRIGDNTIGAQRAGVTDEYIEKSIMKFYGTGTDIPEGT
jgi:serine acetyltransferase